MTNKTKELVAAGHALAKELHCAESAALVRELATQLDVQLSRGNALAAENAGLMSAHPQPFGPEMMKALDAYEKHQDETPETGMLDAFFILRDSIRVDTTATDAFLAEVRAQGVESAGEYLKQYAQGLHEEARLVLQDAGELCNGFAAQLRKGVQS